MSSELESIQWETRVAGGQSYRLARVPEVDSTNSLALRNLNGLQHGDVLYADRQSGGRGRSNRSWLSLHGNLFVSIVMKPTEAGWEATTLATTSFFLCHVVCCVLDQFQVRGKIKWPNDIRVDGRKIAGILNESIFQGSTPLGCVLGLGVNLQMSEHDLSQIDQPAISLFQLTGRFIPPVEFLDCFLNEFYSRLGSYLKNGFPTLRREYLQCCDFLGKTVTVRSGQETVTGLALTVNPDGALEILMEDGMKRIIHAGEIN